MFFKVVVRIIIFWCTIIRGKAIKKGKFKVVPGLNYYIMKAYGLFKA
jgi:hypothetical protein